MNCLIHVPGAMVIHGCLFFSFWFVTTVSGQAKEGREEILQFASGLTPVSFQVNIQGEFSTVATAGPGGAENIVLGIFYPVAKPTYDALKTNSIVKDLDLSAGQQRRLNEK